MKKETRVHHPPKVELAADNRPLVMPIYQNVKFQFDTIEDTLRAYRGEREGYTYSRVSNPTSRQLELLLAELQQRDDCLTCASGVNAVAQTLISLTKSGDHVLGFLETYSPTREVIRRMLARFGVTHTLLSIEDAAGIERVLASTATRVIMFESPTNPITKIADIESITRLARQHGALTLMDNTFAGYHQHGEFPVDAFVHSLTKYAAGTGDVMGGAVIANKDIMQLLRPDWRLLGAQLDPHAAFLLMRGMRTYFLRYRAQCAAALQVARWLEQQPQVLRVHYPGLESHPRAALARAQMREFGTIVSFDIRGELAAGKRFTEGLKLFALTASLGSTESLVLPPQMMQPRDFNAEQRALCGVTTGSVRLSIGLEAVEDLTADLDQALRGLANHA